jgi:fatty acid desaturase
MAIILGFMGAVWWGVALAKGEARSPLYAISVLPALAAFAALLAPVGIGLWVLAAGFATLLLFDLAQVRKNAAPQWYARLRTRLTVCVLVSLSLVAVLQGRTLF